MITMMNELHIFSLTTMTELSGNKLTRNSSGNTRPQSSQLAEPLRTDPGVKSGISVRDLISTFKKKAAGKELSNFSQKKATTTTWWFHVLHAD